MGIGRIQNSARLLSLLISICMMAGFYAAYHYSRNLVGAADINRTGSLTAISPKRIVDTRDGTGVTPGILTPKSSVKFNVLGNNGVPSAGVSAVNINITIVGPTSNGFTTVYSSDSKRPNAPSMHFNKGITANNFGLVPVAKDGTITLYTSAKIHVVIDVYGWLGADDQTTASKMAAVTASKIFDTRTKIGGHKSEFRKNETVDVRVAGVGEVPINAKAVIVNISAIKPDRSGYVTVYPTGKPRPNIASLSVTNKQNTTNYSIVPIGANGKISVANLSGNMHLLMSIQGYVHADKAGTESIVGVTSGVRILDSRTKLGGRNSKPLSNNEELKLVIAGAGGAPSNVESVTLHITTVSSKSGYLIAKPYGSKSNTNGTADESSAINFMADSITSNTITLPVGPDGSVSLTSKSKDLHIIADINAWTTRQAFTVTKPSQALLTAQQANSDSAKTARKVLQNANKYALNTWWNGEGKRLQTLSFINLRDKMIRQDDPVRRLSMEAFSLATALSTNTYDSTVTGVSKDVAIARTVQLIRYVHSQHVSNTVNGWGSDWQGSLWSSYSGRAAWLLWDSLPEADKKQAINVVYYEANDAAGKAAEYQKNNRGEYIRGVGDTGSDSTSWWAMPMQLASVMLPNDPHAAIWKHTYIEFALASWARSSDLQNNTIVNGTTVSNWIDGSNVEPNGIVYNHNRIAPDYMTLMYQTLDDVWLNSVVGQPTPQASKQQIPGVYNAYTSVTYSGTRYASPGGTLYTPNSARIYYPEGIDWGDGQQLPYALVDAQVFAFGIGSSTAEQYMKLHLKAASDMQARFTDGRMYTNDSELNYIGKEEHVSQIAAQLLLALHVAENNQVSFTNQPYFVTQP